MAVKNRPTIGTVHCWVCDGTRSVHMYEKGSSKGKLYSRCPSCPESKDKFISRLSVAEQTLLRSKTTFKPEFTHLAAVQEQVPAPKPEPVTREPQENQEVRANLEPENRPASDPLPDPTPTRKGGGLWVAGFVGIILITIGAVAA